MRDLCDVAQVMWQDRIERQFLADRALAGSLAAAGVKDIEGALSEFGTVDDARSHFLEALAAPIERSARDDRSATILTALEAARAS